ncbi:MAG: hypothetical protein H6631_18950 [Anaerolineaceae bacterium]|nr:hypothetical protein [Anaerolineaceae bacterium]MCB9098594.1 hypothetical protein [Anaerolineales bacterium]
MSNQNRLEVRVDIFEKTNQRALALAEVTPPEFVASILQEFRELEYLSDSPADYRLLKAGDRTPLDNESDLGGQLKGKENLVLVENELPLPAETRRPTDHIYLSEPLTDKVYKLHWLPAIVGRSSPNQPYNDWVAVNLETHKAGLRASRRHLMITEEAGQYFVAAMSNNPAMIIRDKKENAISITAHKQPLQNGDVIALTRSNIMLKFIVRPQAAHRSGKEEV